MSWTPIASSRLWSKRGAKIGKREGGAGGGRKRDQGVGVLVQKQRTTGIVNNTRELATATLVALGQRQAAVGRLRLLYRVPTARSRKGIMARDPALLLRYRHLFARKRGVGIFPDVESLVFSSLPDVESRVLHGIPVVMAREHVSTCQAHMSQLPSNQLSALLCMYPYNGHTPS